MINYAVTCVSEFAKKQEINIKDTFRYLFEHIDLAMCRPYKDFGGGFYLAELKDDDDMDELYSSENFDKLCDMETVMYHESPACVYSIYQNERNFGAIVQSEIYINTFRIICSTCLINR